jgi:hypothetical protein
MSRELMKRNAVFKLLESLQDNDEPKIFIDNPTRIAKLRSASASYDKVINFKVGDLVQWKEGLRNKGYPEYNEPAMVLEVLTTPLIDKEEGIGSPYHNEPLNLRLGMIDEGGDLMSFYYDGKRFEIYNETE